MVLVLSVGGKYSHPLKNLHAILIVQPVLLAIKSAISAAVGIIIPGANIVDAIPFLQLIW
ncbi:hypothetical protein O5478_18330 [Escherichia coli]|nr:hypothetical protein [Escherichia coli]